MDLVRSFLFTNYYLLFTITNMNIDGKKIAQEILDGLKTDLAKLEFKPKLIDVLVGEDQVVETYVRIKAKRAEEIGVDFELRRFPADISQEQLEKEVVALNATPNLCGLIIQLPLPENLDRQKILDKIDPRFDVDVITSTNLGSLFTGRQFFIPATAAAIIHIIDYEKILLEGKSVLMVGAGDLVGKPVTFLLMQRHATTTIANAATRNLKELALNADIIISGTGVPKLITGDMVKNGAVIIDAGTAESAGGIGGDVDFDAVAPKASLITPVPGGVGPVTVAMLLYNTVQSAKRLK